MQVTASVGIAKGMSAEQKQRLLQEMQRHMKDPRIYAGHSYFICFDFEGNFILMDKWEDESVTLGLSGDTDSKMYLL